MSTRPETQIPFLPTTLKNYSLPSGQQIRAFSDPQLQNAIEKAMSTLGPDQHVASIAHFDLNGASLSIVAKVPGTDKVTIMAAAYKEWKGDLKAEAEVRFAL